MRKITFIVVLLAALLAGCTSTLQDLEGVDAVDPHAVEVYRSPDQFPNLMQVCLDEAGPTVLITTRDYLDPIVMSETCVLDARAGDR